MTGWWAASLAENCGGTLIIHVEKALYPHQGAYPTPVQAFAAHFGGDCVYINREDDAGDQGLMDLQAAVSAGAPGREAAVRGPVRGGPPAGDPHCHHPPADPDAAGGAGRGRL